MKTKVIGASLALFLLLVAFIVDVATSLALFLIVGVIPGTNISIPANYMLFGYGCITWFLIRRYMTLPVFLQQNMIKIAKRQLDTKRQFLRRRFDHI